MHSALPLWSATTAKPPAYDDAELGILLGPGQFNWDASLIKTTKFTERQTPQFRTEFFNLFNHPQFANPATSRNTPGTFGQTTTTNPRVIQPALKYIF